MSRNRWRSAGFSLTDSVMTQANAERLGATARPRNDGYRPRQFNRLTRGRFLRARERHHLSRVTGSPTVAQREMAASMAVLEWSSLQAEREGTLQSLREAREHRRLLLRVLADFERSLAAPPPKEKYASRLPSAVSIKAI